MEKSHERQSWFNVQGDADGCGSAGLQPRLEPGYRQTQARVEGRARLCHSPTCRTSNIFFCSIAGAYFSGLANGTSATTYNPMGLVSREQMAAFVISHAGSVAAAGEPAGGARSVVDAGASITAMARLWWLARPIGVASDGTDLWVANVVSDYRSHE